MSFVLSSDWFASYLIRNKVIDEESHAPVAGVFEERCFKLLLGKERLSEQRIQEIFEAVQKEISPYLFLEATPNEDDPLEFFFPMSGSAISVQPDFLSGGGPELEAFSPSCLSISRSAARVFSDSQEKSFNLLRDRFNAEIQALYKSGTNFELGLEKLNSLRENLLAREVLTEKIVREAFQVAIEQLHKELGDDQETHLALSLFENRSRGKDVDSNNPSDYFGVLAEIESRFNVLQNEREDAEKGDYRSKYAMQLLVSSETDIWKIAIRETLAKGIEPCYPDADFDAMTVLAFDLAGIAAAEAAQKKAAEMPDMDPLERASVIRAALKREAAALDRAKKALRETDANHIAMGNEADEANREFESGPTQEDFNAEVDGIVDDLFAQLLNEAVEDARQIQVNRQNDCPENT